MSTVHAAFDSRIFHLECLSLAEAGYDVRLIARRDRGETVPGVRLHVLPDPPSRLVRVVLWPWLAYREVLSIRPRPAICHLHDPELLPVGMALRLKGFAVIFDVHENVAASIATREYLPRPSRTVASWAYRFVEAILTSGMATVHVLDSIAARYRRPRAVVRNLPRLDLGLPPSRRRQHRRTRLIYVGGIARERGAIRMLRLAGELRRRGIDLELRLVGQVEDDVLDAHMQAVIREEDLGEAVVLTGKVTFERAQEEVAAADIGLCLLDPTPNFLNSLPIKVFEYMRSGVPVVASDFDCWRQYVTGTGSGVQVSVTDIAGMADAVQALLADPEALRRMGEAGRRAVLDEYCWEKEKQRLLTFYREILSARQGNSQPR